MSYLICPSCRLTTFSEALWNAVEECPRCGAPVPSRASGSGASITPITSHPRFRSNYDPDREE